MKKASVIFLFMLFLLHCQGQNLLQEGKLWSNTSIGTEGGSTYKSNFIKFMGDTTINELVYKKIWKSDDALHAKWTLNGCIREEPSTQKVFILNESTGKDMLLYDFSLETGDSILTGDGVSYIKVTNVINATFSSSAVIRKQICFFDSNDPLWIEGIGSLWGVLEGLNSFFTTGATTNLVCYTENGGLVYQNPNYPDCFFTSIKDIKADQKFIDLIPQQGGEIQIRIKDNRWGELFLFSLDGRQVLNKGLSNSTTIICAPTCGILLYRYIGQHGQVQTGKVLVQ